MPRDSGDISAADVLDSYLARLKQDLGLDEGRFLRTGDGVALKKTPVGRNTLSKFPSEMAKVLGIDQPDGFTFNSFRRSAACTVADATPVQGFFGRSNAKADYLTTSAAGHNLAVKVEARETPDSGTSEPTLQAESDAYYVLGF